MNICIIGSTYFPEMTGVAVHIRNMMNEYSNKGHHVLLLCPDYSVAEDLYPNYMDYIGEVGPNIYVKPVPSYPHPMRRDKIEFQHYTQWKLEDYLENFQPDAIIVEDPAKAHGLALFGLTGADGYGKSIGVDYAREKNIPVIAVYQTNFPLLVEYIIPAHVPTPYRLDKFGVYQQILGEYDLVLCGCNEVKKFIVSHGLENVKSGAYIGINQNIFKEPGKSHLVKNDESIKLFYAGRFQEDKDIHSIFEIYRNLKRICPNVSIYIAGRGPGEEAVREICAKETDMVWLGFLEQRELVLVYNSVDIYFSPHPTETYGISILEAMSKGLPIVTSDSGGPKDLVEKGVRGFRCSAMDEYVDALKRLVEDADLRRRMGDSAKEFASNYYCDKCADNFLKEIETLMKSAPMREREV